MSTSDRQASKHSSSKQNNMPGWQGPLQTQVCALKTQSFLMVPLFYLPRQFCWKWDGTRNWGQKRVPAALPLLGTTAHTDPSCSGPCLPPANTHPLLKRPLF